MTQSELNEILEKHRKWLNDEEGGEKATLSGADLSGADLRRADLRRANLRRANLRQANLRRADLSGADLSGAILTNVKYNENTAFFALCCPEEGSFIGFKKAGGKIIKLLIPEDSKRSSATTRKCRCSKAKVLSITEKDISRDPFGDFEIAFKMSAQNGAVEMEIRNRAYPILNRRAKSYESFEGAVSALSEYFEEIDGYAKKVAQSVKERAKKASQYIIGQEIEKIAGEML